MNATVFPPVATAIEMARSLTPSAADVLTQGGGPFAVMATIPAVLVHIFVREIEEAYAEIGRLEAMVMLAGEPEGSA